MSTGRKYYVTIDREEWKSASRWQVWKHSWWIERSRRADKIQGVGRTVFEIDRDTGFCRAAFELPQHLDVSVLNGSWTAQNAWTKSFTRGLRAITPLAGGDFVINDIFGIYHVNTHGNVKQYLTRPDLSDIHCAVPNASNTRILVTSTGTEEIVELDWEGNVHLRIHLPELFGLPNSERVAHVKRKHPDHRTMPLDHSRELFHANWAQWIDEGRRLYVSLHAPGKVAIIDIDKSGAPSLGRSWSYFPQCHGPAFDFETNSLMVAVSKADQVRELSLDDGRIIWAKNGMSYSKRVRPVDADIAVACDCNGRRIVEISRADGSEVWSSDVPGLPYDVSFTLGSQAYENQGVSKR
jgi:hypothetical protein